MMIEERPCGKDYRQHLKGFPGDIVVKKLPAMQRA